MIEGWYSAPNWPFIPRVWLNKVTPVEPMPIPLALEPSEEEEVAVGENGD